jgi:hypothetical protein
VSKSACQAHSEDRVHAQGPSEHSDHSEHRDLCRDLCESAH